MSDVTKLFSELRRERNKLSQRGLAERANLSQNTMWRIETGKMKLVSEHLQPLAKELGLPVGKFVEMLLGISTNVTPVLPSVHSVPLLSYQQAVMLSGMKNGLADVQTSERKPTQKQHSARSFAVSVDDESMSPRFNVGDIVVLDPDVDIQPNDLVLAVVDQRMLTFRQFHSRGQDPATGQRRFDLVPLSPAFETWHSTEHEIELLGAMVEFTSFAR